MNDITKKTTEVLSAPLGELIAAVGKGVAEAQEALDTQALETFRKLYLDDSELYAELKKVGYQPTWYRIPEADAEIKLVLTATETQASVGTGELTGKNPVGLNAMPIDATVANQYNFSLAASSSLKFKVVPVPPPASLEDQRVVPEVLGKTVDAATELLTANNLSLIIKNADELAVEDVGALKVVGQVPNSGALLSNGAQVQVTVAVNNTSTLSE
ncbi:PASTA domain-containing protein [Marinibactrum halimedae]|uniref:PASTA domain-containing protein n=1 Tax=Marinibactrum halimedae TaxID=1444977 RepID=A0AA37WKM7_9GAMM|nr:PASTA domain-containing protein [Marinibactrum halimedae]MCD9460278.1 PASTA domain-containing protein [Marinibactrum halimedae]GLS24365.1 hypothetical protein GCM10007877_00760 [Marinibactrum halimedae]